MIDGRNFFDQPVKNNLITYDNIRSIATGQEMTTQLVAYYIIITLIITAIDAIDLSIQQVLDADPKAIQQINFTTNLDRDGDTTCFIIEETKETILDFSQGTVKCCNFILF